MIGSLDEPAKFIFMPFFKNYRRRQAVIVPDWLSDDEDERYLILFFNDEPRIIATFQFYIFLLLKMPPRC